MFIFGWGRQTVKQIGIVFKNLCKHCNNEKYWVLSRITTWFTLFFIPVIPYSVKYFLSCPVCQYGITLNDAQIQQLKPLAEMNQLLVDGHITEKDYANKIDQLDKKPGETESKILEENNQKISYCQDCGNKIIDKISFCGNCGVKVTT